MSDSTPASLADFDAAARPTRPFPIAVVKLIRPHQWTKNGLCLAGVIFGPGRLTDLHAVALGLLTVAIFCAASSSVYVLNDLLDRERDRAHPRKRHRPIASGAISPAAGVVIVALLLLFAAAGFVALSNARTWFGFGDHLHPRPIHVLVCVALYLANNILYSTKLKHYAIFDVLSIAMGFVLRLLAGIYVLGDLPTTWITLCTFFLAMFLGFGKRRGELAGLLPHEHSRRPVLSKYSLEYLDSLLNSSATMVVMCYALFTTSSGKDPSLIVTLPFVYYAIMHYKRLVLLFSGGEEPDRVVLKDIRIQACIVGWLGTFLAVVYFKPQLFTYHV